MRAAQDILFGVTGQTLIYDAQEGRPSSVTSVEIFPWDASDDADSEWAGSASVETSPNTTLDGSAGPSQSNPRNIPITATTGTEIGRTFLVTGAAGLSEWIEVASITSADSVTARHPLHNDYASGATFQSTRLTCTVDATWVADLANVRNDAGPNPHYRVRWVYVVGGKTYARDSYFNLVRYAGVHGVQPSNIESLAAGWLDTLPSDHRDNQGRDLISDAYTAVKFDLHGVMIDDASVAHGELIDEVVRYKTIELGEFAKIIAGGGDEARYQIAKTAYQARLDSLLRITNKAPIRDTTGAAQPRTAIGVSRR